VTSKLQEGEQLYSEGRIEEAEAAFLEAIRIQEEKVHEAHNNLGVMYFEKQDFAKATEHLTQALEANPSYKQAAENLAAVLTSMGQGEQAETLLAPFLNPPAHKPPIESADKEINTEDQKLKALIAQERRQVIEQIIASDLSNDRSAFLNLWYHFHYLPKTRYNSIIDWYIFSESIRSIHVFSQKWVSYHQGKLSDKNSTKEEIGVRKKILYILEGYDLDNPVLRHYLNLIQYTDQSEYEVWVASRFSENHFPQLKDKYLEGINELKEAGAQFVSFSTDDPIERIDELITFIIEGRCSHLLFHTGFQVSWLLYLANIIKAIEPEIFQVGSLWDPMEEGGDEYAPYDHLIATFAPNLEKVKTKPVHLMNYLFANPEKFDEAQSGINDLPKEFSSVAQSLGVDHPVFFGIMIGKSVIRIKDANFWQAIEDVLQANKNSLFVIIGLSHSELEKYTHSSIVKKRTLAFGFSKDYHRYLCSLDLFIDTFISGLTSVKEAHENGVPVFIRRVVIEGQPKYNFPTELLPNPNLQTLDEPNDIQAWKDKLSTILQSKDMLIDIKKTLRANQVSKIEEYRDQVAKTYRSFKKPSG